MNSWERIRELADQLHEYGYHHTYTDWESEQISTMTQGLSVLAVRVEDEFKQVRRSAGGLTNKVRTMGETIKKLEERLEELESELAEAKNR